MKRILGFLLILPYVIIGFIEMFYRYKADSDFKTNMMWAGVIGLFVFFNREMIQIYTLIKTPKNGTEK